LRASRSAVVSAAALVLLDYGSVTPDPAPAAADVTAAPAELYDLISR
jgi:hypothetical protein